MMIGGHIHPAAQSNHPAAYQDLSMKYCHYVIRQTNEIKYCAKPLLHVLLKYTVETLQNIYRPLTLSTPAVPNCCCSKGPAPYWSNPPFLIFDISGALALSPERQSARMSKIKNGGLDQYDRV